MNRWMRKHNKKLLAILGVFLMISFIATLGPRGGMGRSGKDVVAGHIGKTPVYANQLRSAKEQWTWLHSLAQFTAQGQRIPLVTSTLAMAVIGNDPFAAQDFTLQFQAVQIANHISNEIEQHPELFFLLQQDAQQNGIVVSKDDVSSFLVNRLDIQPDSQRAQEGGFEAAQGLLLIAGELQRLHDLTKISQPVWQHDAEQYQYVRLNLVDFRTDEFEKSVPSPTPQQLQEFFDKYKNAPSREPNSSLGGDSLGFGYQIPARVTLQYITIAKAQVEQSLAPTPEKQYEWAVKAAEYYTAHQEEFKNTPPATNPTSAPSATQPATQASTQAASQPTTLASSQPAIKPFAEVQQQIIGKLMAADVAKQTALIEKEIETQLASDWKAIGQANPAATQPATTQPSNAPASQPTLPQMTLARLEQLRADIQQKMHVSLELHEMNNWQDAKQLAALPGIGTAETADHAPFRQYALSFTGQPISFSSAALQIWEPSQPLTDSQGNAYVFRLTSAQSAHAPAELNSVIAQVTKDWKNAQAYELAKQAAQKLLDSARSIGLAQASRGIGAQMIATDKFAPRSGNAIPGYALTDTAAQINLDQASGKLLGQATPSDQHPVTQVELPTAQRIVVAELGSAQLSMPIWYVQLNVIETQRQTAGQKLADDWFSYSAVVSRMAYKPEEKQQGT